jgi:aquaporin Z
VSCCVVEVVATFFFLYVIMGTTSAGAAAGSPAFPIGLCLKLIHLFLIPVTNASVNPARSTGVALCAGGPYIVRLWLFRLARSPARRSSVWSAVGPPSRARPGERRSDRPC